MANIQSAKKRIRQIAKRTERNRSHMSKMRTFIKKVESAIESGDKTAAQSAFKDAQRIIHKTAQHGVVHRNTASRTVSRLSTRVKALG